MGKARELMLAKAETTKLRRWHNPLDLRLQILQARPGFIAGKWRLYFRL